MCISPFFEKSRLDLLRHWAWNTVAILAIPFIFARFAVETAARAASRRVPGTREQIRFRLSKGWRPDWPTVRRLWASASTLDVGPIDCFLTGQMMRTAEYMMFRAAVDDRRIASSELRAAVSVDAPTLSAYCIMTLWARGDTALLADLPDGILRSNRGIRWRYRGQRSRESLQEMIADCKSQRPPNSVRANGTSGAHWENQTGSAAGLKRLRNRPNCGTATVGVLAAAFTVFLGKWYSQELIYREISRRGGQIHLFEEGTYIGFQRQVTTCGNGHRRTIKRVTSPKAFRDDDLDFLRRVPRLLIVDLTSTSVSREEIARFQREFPNCTVW